MGAGLSVGNDSYQDEWIRFGVSDDVLSLDATTLDVPESRSLQEIQTSMAEADLDQIPCTLCYQYSHSRRTCPMNATLQEDSKSKKPEHTVSSKHASLMEGIIDHEVVRKSFMSSLSKDLAKYTAQHSSFQDDLEDRVQALRMFHGALSDYRESVRSNISVDDKKDEQDEKDVSAADLLVNMNMQLLTQTMELGNCSTQSPICKHLLKSLEVVLKDSFVKPLCLRGDEKSRKWNKLVVDWLSGVVQSKDDDPDDLKSRAIVLLMHVLLQSGSLSSALRSLLVISLTKGSFPVDQVADILTELSKLQPQLRLHSTITSTNNYLGAWEFMYPNFNLAEAKEQEKEDANSNNSRMKKRSRNRFTGFGGLQPNQQGQKSSKKIAPTSIACDGSYLYIHCEDGLIKLGTGYNSTQRGHIYKHLPNFRPKDEVQLAHLNGCLYFRATSDDGSIDNKLYAMCCQSLTVTKEFEYPQDANPSTKSPLFACPDNLYIVRVQRASSSSSSPSPSADKKSNNDQDDQDDNNQDTYQVIGLRPSTDSDQLEIVSRTDLLAIQPPHKVARHMVDLQCVECKGFHMTSPMYSKSQPGKLTQRLCKFCKDLFPGAAKIIKPQKKENAANSDFQCWYKPANKGQPPTARFGGRAVQVNLPDAKTKEIRNLIYYFGGASGRPLQWKNSPSGIEMAYNDMHVYDIESSTWTRLTTTGEAPSPRLGHSLVLDESDKTSFIVFGGAKNDSDEEIYQDTYRFDCTSNQWTKISTTGSIPTARYYHSCTVDDNKLYVYGGKTETKVESDLYTLDLKTNVWSKTGKTSGYKPPARMGHFSFIRDGHFYVMGGIAGQNVSQANNNFKLDMRVSLDEKTGKSAPALKWHTVRKNPMYHIDCLSACGIIKNQLFVFGGGMWGSYNESVSIFDIDTEDWQPMTVPKGETPGPIGQAACAVFKNKLYIFGGGNHIGAQSRTFALETAANPYQVMTPESMKESSFYSDGKTLVMVNPPLQPPNVILAGWMSRVFDLTSGEFVMDCDNGLSAPCNTVTYDSENNVLWGYDRSNHKIRRWINASPALDKLKAVRCVPDQDDSALVDVKTKDLTWQTLADYIVSALDRFTAPVVPPLGQLDFSIYAREELPFSLEIDESVFVMLASVLELYLDMLTDSSSAPSDVALAQRVLPVALELILVQMIEFDDGFFISELVNEKNEPIPAKLCSLLTQCTQLPFGKETSKTILLAWRVLATGLPDFYPSFAERVAWFKQFCDIHFQVSNDDELNAALEERLTAMALHLSQETVAFSFQLLVPPSSQEGALPLTVHSSSSSSSSLVETKSSSSTTKIEQDDTPLDRFDNPLHLLDGTELQAPAAVSRNTFGGLPGLNNQFGNNSNNLAVYVSHETSNQDLLFRHKKGVEITPTRFMIQQVDLNKVKAKHLPENSRNIMDGMMFVLKDVEPSTLAEVAKFNDYTEEQYEEWRESAGDDAFGPVGYFHFPQLTKKEREELKREKAEHADSDDEDEDDDDDTQITVHIPGNDETRQSGKYILLKLVRSEPPLKSESDTKKAQSSSSSSSSFSSPTADLGAISNGDNDEEEAAPDASARMCMHTFEIYGSEQSGASSTSSLVEAKSGEGTATSLSLMQYLIRQAASFTKQLLNATDSRQVASLQSRLKNCIRMLQNAQSHIASRSAQCSSKENKKSSGDKKNKKKASHTISFLNPAPVVVLLMSYVEDLFQLSAQTLGLFNDKFGQVNDSSTLDEKALLELLDSSYVRVLLPPLLTGLFTLATDGPFVMRVLPAGLVLLQSLDQLVDLSSNSFVAQLLSSHEASYLQSPKQRFSNYLASLKDDDVKGTLYKCAVCSFSEQNESEMCKHYEERHELLVKAHSKHSTHWLLELLRTLGSFGGKCAAVLSVGAPISDKERQHNKWLTAPLFQGGLELKIVASLLKKKAAKAHILRQMGRIGSVRTLAGNQTNPEELWESIPEIEAQIPTSEDITFYREMVGEGDTTDNKAEHDDNKRLRYGARLLSSMTVRTKVVGNWRSLDKPIMHQAFNFLKVALIKHLGLTKEAITFALVLAGKHEAKADGSLPKLRFRSSDLPRSLAQIWTAIDALRMWIIKYRQDTFKERDDAKSEEKDQKSNSSSSDTAPQLIRTLSAEARAQDELEAAAKEKFYQDMGSGIIAKCRLLMMVQTRHTPSSLVQPSGASSDDLPGTAPSFARAGSAMSAPDDQAPNTSPMFIRAASSLRPDEQVANEEKEAQEQAVDDALVMWKAVLKRQRHVHLPSLKRQPSSDNTRNSSAQGNKAGMGSSSSSSASAQNQTFTTVDVIDLFLKSNTEIDPQKQAERTAAESKRSAAGVVLEPEQQEQLPELNMGAFVRYLLKRRLRAHSRIAGFTFFQELTSATSIMSVQHEILSYLAPALRGDEDIFSLAQKATKQSDKSKSKVEEASGPPIKPFHYSDGIIGCGSQLTEKLQDVFHRLFNSIGKLLRTHVGLLANEKQQDLSTNNDFPACQHLMLSILACWGMNFDETDHLFLDRCGVIHLIRDLMEMQTDESDQDANENAETKKLSSMQRLREGAWATFRLLALACFNGESAGRNKTTGRAELTKFQVSIIELTFNLIRSTAEALNDPLQQETKSAAGKETKGMELDGQEDQQEQDEEEEEEGTSSPEDTCFGMLRLVVTMCGPSPTGQVERSRSLQDDDDNDEKGSSNDLVEHKEAEQPEDTVSTAVIQHISSDRFIPLLFTLLANGTPRIQRMTVRVLRRILPTCDPELAILSTQDNSSTPVKSYLVNLIGTLLCKPTSKSGDAMEEGQRQRSAQLDFALASELITLVRILFAQTSTPWTSALRALVDEYVAEIPQLISSPPSSATAKLCNAMASLSIIGGARETLRTGGKVQVFGTSNRKKRKNATVLQYDPVGATAQVVYDAATAKKVEQVPKRACMVGVDEVWFDPCLMPLTLNCPLLKAFAAVITHISPNEAEASSNNNNNNGDLKSSDLKSSESSAQTASVNRSIQNSPAANDTLMTMQLISRANRALWNLLQHKPSVETVLKADFGPMLTRVSQTETSIIIGDPSSGKLEDTERRLDLFREMCTEQKLSFKTLHSEGGNADADKKVQMKMLPYSPYAPWSVKLPSCMTSENLMCIPEDDEKLIMVTRGRVQPWDDTVNAWANAPIPKGVPSFYFEVTLLNRGTEGQIVVGLFAVGKPNRNMLGLESGSCGITDDSRVDVSGKRDKVIKWGKNDQGEKISAYWSEGDVVGVLLDRVQGRVSFTLNGHIKTNVCQLPTQRRQYIPAVSFSTPGARVQFNFGQRPFRYKFSASRWVPRDVRVGGYVSQDDNDDDSDASDQDDLGRKQNLNDRKESKASQMKKKNELKKEAEFMLKKKELAEEEERKRKEEEDKKKEEKEQKEGKEGKDGKEGSEEKKGADGKETKEQPEPSVNPFEEEKKRENALADMMARLGAPEDAASEEQKREEFDAWASESEFSDGGESEPNSSDDEQDNYNNYYYGRRRKPAKKAVAPPLTMQQVNPGLVLSIKPPKTEEEKKAEEEEAQQQNYGFGGRRARSAQKSSKKKKKVIPKTGTVVRTDERQRQVLLSFFDPETASIVFNWYPLSQLATFRPMINSDLHKHIPRNEDGKVSYDVVHKDAWAAEASLSVTYSRQALLVIMTQWLAMQRKKSEDARKQLDKLTAQDHFFNHPNGDEGHIAIQSLGGFTSLLETIRRAALDEFSEIGTRGAAHFGEEIESGNINETHSTHPMNVFRRFLITILMYDRGAHRQALAQQLRDEAVAQLRYGTGRHTWLQKMRSLEHIVFGCWLIDLLLTSDAAIRREFPDRPALHVYTVEIFNALIAILKPAKKMKKFKPSGVVMMVIPLVSRLLTKFDSFDAPPNTSKLDWLADRMQARYRQETKSLGPDSAVSKPLQHIISLILIITAIRQEQQKKASDLSADQKGDAKSGDTLHELDFGPSLDSMSWFEKALQVSEIMRALENTEGPPDWFVRASWLHMHANKECINIESSHPYQNDEDWTELIIKDASELDIRVDGKSITDVNDKLIFAIIDKQTTEDEPVLKSHKEGGDLKIVGEYSGKMYVNGTGAFVGQTGQKKGVLTHKSNCIWYKFEQSDTPVHTGTFCSACEFPIRGKRYTCVCCTGPPRNDRYGNRLENQSFNLCGPCESNNQDTGDHDRAHIFVEITRPLPKDSSVPRVISRLESLLSKENMKVYKSGKGDPNQVHTGVECSECKKEIQGIRWKCSVCPGYELCDTCKSDTKIEQHDRSHPFFKIRFPIENGSLLKSSFSTFHENIISEDTYWGYRFSAQPTYEVKHQRSLLAEHKENLTFAIEALHKAATDVETNILANQQLVEMVNRAVTKSLSTKSSDKRNMSSRRYRRGRGRRFAGDRNDNTSDAKLMPLYIEPNKVVPDRKALVVYPALANLPIDSVLIRMSILKLLNKQLISVLPLIDWSLVRQKWSLSSTFGNLRGLVFSSLKQELWRSALRKSAAHRVPNGRKNVQLDNHMASQARFSAEELDPLDTIDMTMFGQLFGALRRTPPQTLRTPNQPFRVRYVSEAGVDAGGLFRDCLTNICNELQSSYVPLFLPCPNARHGVGITLDKFIPNRGCTSDIYLSMYEFVGKMMGMAIRVNNPLSLDLPSLVWKPLVGMPLSLGDLTAVDSICVNAMSALLDDAAHEDKGVNKDNFQEIYPFTFTYASSDETIVELIENGANTPVTWENRAMYASLVQEFRLHECQTQVAAIRRGLTSIIPSRFLSLLTWKELELEVCGSPEIDIDLLKQNTEYRGCSSTDQHIKYFWKVLTGFSQLERAQFLRFVWGRSRLPPPNKFTEKMKIDSSNSSIEHLPNAHTCFFSLELPRYTSEDMMRDKILKAITYCTSIENV